MKVRTPAEVIDTTYPSPSLAETVKVTGSPSASVAVTLPMAVWFSAALNAADEVKVGALSFTLVTFTVIT